MSLNRRTLLGMGAALATPGALLLPRAARANTEAWPATTRLIVPLPAGGAVDTMARKLGEQLAPRLGTTLIVENKPGASGILAARFVTQAPADGSQILFMHSGLVTAQAVTGRIDILRDFRPVTKISAGPQLLVVRGDSPYKTLIELIGAIKGRPGEIKYGTGGNGSPTHLAFEWLDERVPGGLKANQIPFKGAIDSVIALVGGEIDFCFTPPSLAVEHVRTGRLRALATTGASRLAAAPNLPTVGEAGVPGYVFDAWGGLAVPFKTPDAQVDRLFEAVRTAAASPEFAGLLARIGGVPDASASPKAFTDQLRAAIPLEKALVTRLGIQAE